MRNFQTQTDLYDDEGFKPNVLESLVTASYDSYDRNDIEQFVYSLTYDEVVILLFKSLGYKPEEIVKFVPNLSKAQINHLTILMKLKHKEALGDI